MAAPTNASKWRMGFNSAFKGLKTNANLKWDFGVSGFSRHNGIFSPLRRLYKNGLLKGLDMDAIQLTEPNILNVIELML